MDEQVLAGLVGRDEPEALLVAEPLHGSVGHAAASCAGEARRCRSERLRTRALLLRRTECPARFVQCRPEAYSGPTGRAPARPKRCPASSPSLPDRTCRVSQCTLTLEGPMAGRKKTTFAKLDRETKQRERRIAKQMRKDARKLASAHEADQ